MDSLNQAAHAASNIADNHPDELSHCLIIPLFITSPFTGERWMRLTI